MVKSSQNSKHGLNAWSNSNANALSIANDRINANTWSNANASCQLRMHYQFQMRMCGQLTASEILAAVISLATNI